jgi:hypothetical protein
MTIYAIVAFGFYSSRGQKKTFEERIAIRRQDLASVPTNLSQPRTNRTCQDRTLKGRKSFKQGLSFHKRAKRRIFAHGRIFGP